MLTSNITPPLRGELEGGFKLRCYGRTELAQMYCPDILPDSAYRKFASWLQRNPRLRPLAHQRERCFTPAQVAMIVSELGEP